MKANLQGGECPPTLKETNALNVLLNNGRSPVYFANMQ